jgi:hypothetical protein
VGAARAVSYGPDVIRDFLSRYGSVRAAEARARSVPAFAEEIQKVERRLAWVAALARERTRPALDADERAYRREVGFAPPELVSAELARLQARREDLIVAALNDDGRTTHATRRRPGRPEGPVPTSEDTFLAILRLVVEEDASARRIERETDADRELSFVNRNKAGRLTTWVKRHPSAARRALDRHEIPPGFRDTGGGVIFPKP